MAGSKTNFFVMNSQGSAHPILIFAFLGLILAILFGPSIIKNKSESNTLETVTQSTPIETQLPSATPTLSPSPTPTPTPIPTPKPTVAPTKTPAPTKAPVSGPPGSGYSNITVATERGNFSISVVSIDMSGVRMITDTASDNDCASDCPTLALADYVSRNGAFAGINGTYFCPPDYADCASKKNSFDYPVFNTRLGKWINATNLFWNDRSMMYQEGGQMKFRRDAKSGASGSGAIVNAPGLVDGGSVIVEQFPLTSTQRSKGTRGGMGIRGNIVYLVVARNADMIDFAHIFKSLGADSALNLDGGGSAALWFGGYKAGPGRTLPNAVVFSR